MSAETYGYNKCSHSILEHLQSSSWFYFPTNLNDQPQLDKEVRHTSNII